MSAPTVTKGSDHSLDPCVAEQLKKHAAEFRLVQIEQARMPDPDLRDRSDPEYLLFRDTVLRPDVRKRGIQVPLLGHQSGEFVQIDDGGSRLEVGRLEGLAVVPVLVWPTRADPAAARKATFLANEIRKDFSPAERSRFYLNEMRQTGLTRAAFCREYGLVESTVCRRLRWLEVVPEDLHDKVGEGDGRVPERGGYALKDVEPERRREVFQKMLDGLLTVEALEKQNKQAKGKGRGRQPPVKARTANGLATVIPALGLDQIIAELGLMIDAVKKLQKHGLPLSALQTLLRRGDAEVSSHPTV